MASGNVAGVAVFIIFAGSTLVPAAAFADEAFLCGPSKVVYVKSEDIELKKKTDPCIAAYFGLTVEAPDTAPAPVPAGKPATAARTIGAVKAAPQFKSLAAPEQAERLGQVRSRTAAPMPPEPVPDTDFRNVRVINASSEDARWFRHDK